MQSIRETEGPLYPDSGAGVCVCSVDTAGVGWECLWGGKSNAKEDHGPAQYEYVLYEGILIYTIKFNISTKYL